MEGSILSEEAEVYVSNPSSKPILWVRFLLSLWLKYRSKELELSFNFSVPVPPVTAE